MRKKENLVILAKGIGKLTSAMAGLTVVAFLVGTVLNVSIDIIDRKGRKTKN